MGAGSNRDAWMAIVVGAAVVGILASFGAGVWMYRINSTKKSWPLVGANAESWRSEVEKLNAQKIAGIQWKRLEVWASQIMDLAADFQKQSDVLRDRYATLSKITHCEANQAIDLSRAASDVYVERILEQARELQRLLRVLENAEIDDPNVVVMVTKICERLETDEKNFRKRLEALRKQIKDVEGRIERATDLGNRGR